jgi:PTH1 family peptidyl-tRNA hydrolase
MKLIIGLGNPKREYRNTYHNLGFLALDFIKNKRGFSRWQLKKNLEAKISKGRINREKIILAKPQTFMNRSGEAVSLLLKNLKLKTENLWVIHDDIDLSLGKIKISKNRGSAGHKGVQSIIDSLGSKNFYRIRIGIFDRPISEKNKELTQKYVLKKLNKKEKERLPKIIEEAVGLLFQSLNGRDKNLDNRGQKLSKNPQKNS